MVWYWVFNIVLAIWVSIDAKKRNNEFLNWAFGTILLGPIIAPVYLAKRNLKSGEVREGGTAWNILKNFALVWTAAMVVAFVVFIFRSRGAYYAATDRYEQVGTAMGSAMGFVLIALIWIVPIIVAMILGFFLKKSSVVEKGPTGNIKPEVKSSTTIDFLTKQ